jgi:hypothetical protein
LKVKSIFLVPVLVSLSSLVLAYEIKPGDFVYHDGEKCPVIQVNNATKKIVITPAAGQPPFREGEVLEVSNNEDLVKFSEKPGDVVYYEGRRRQVVGTSQDGKSVILKDVKGGTFGPHNHPYVVISNQDFAVFSKAPETGFYEGAKTEIWGTNNSGETIVRDAGGKNFREGEFKTVHSKDIVRDQRAAPAVPAAAAKVPASTRHSR